MNRRLFFLSYWTFLSAPCEAAEWRALVICNGAHPGKPIANPVNDSKPRTETVKGVGFRTTVVMKTFYSLLVRRRCSMADRTARPPEDAYLLCRRSQKSEDGRFLSADPFCQGPRSTGHPSPT